MTQRRVKELIVRPATGAAALEAMEVRAERFAAYFTEPPFSFVESPAYWLRYLMDLYGRTEEEVAARSAMFFDVLDPDQGESMVGFSGCVRHVDAAIIDNTQIGHWGMKPGDGYNIVTCLAKAAQHTEDGQGRTIYRRLMDARHHHMVPSNEGQIVAPDRRLWVRTAKGYAPVTRTFEHAGYSEVPLVDPAWAPHKDLGGNDWDCVIWAVRPDDVRAFYQSDSQPHVPVRTSSAADGVEHRA
ncbi:MAG: hypothetical protein KDD66_13460 [Bdellovibrionales bacterium]|nr:hypothetical protein [Bdellovibrionales bacterium]